MRRSIGILFLLGLMAMPAEAADLAVKIGVLNDRNAIFADITGEGSVVAARMAVDDFKGPGIKVEIVQADHQNKPDLGASIARQWFDEQGVTAIVDVPGSAIALAISNLAEEKRRILLAVAAGAASLSGEACKPTTFQWAYDTWSQANAVGKLATETVGKDWFIIAADYAFGHALQEDLARAVTSSGGRVVGAVRAPLGTADFSSFLLRAQASGAKVIGLALAGTDLINVIKQGQEFGLVQGGQNFATPIMFISDVKTLGLKTAQGLVLGAPFYWDLNDATRAWSKRFQERHQGRAPTFLQASVYSAVLHYLKAVEKAQSTDADKVAAAIRALPTDDPIFGPGRVASNGRHVHPLHLFKVKAPEQSKADWDFFELLGTVPAERAIRPVSETGCKLASP